jgi:hypothetical protein
MARTVTAADGSQWTVHSTLEWRTPATAVDFEHDISAGRGPTVVMLAIVVVLAMILVVWTPKAVVVPLWLVLIIVLVLLFFPVRWALRRPYTLVAARGDDGEGNPTERWVGTVRGAYKQRQQIARTVRSIAFESRPAVEGPLKPVVTPEMIITTEPTKKKVSADDD